MVTPTHSVTISAGIDAGQPWRRYRPGDDAPAHDPKPRQLDLIRHGAAVADVGGFAIREAVREGLREDSDTVLKPGMVISMEPMLTVPAGQPGAGGYREHDIVFITENGNEDITEYPYGPAFNVVG